MSSNATILLGTALVHVEALNGLRSYAWALIDPGSIISLISESLSKHLKLPRDFTAVPITGAGGVKSTTNGSVSFILSSRLLKNHRYQEKRFDFAKAYFLYTCM